MSNSKLLVESTTQIGAKIVLLSGAAYPEFRLFNAYPTSITGKHRY
ncbi:hypothetical protein [uncultured Shewanella sp.]|nr:hypothetical protein [uncultured Shewanella sp.]